MKPLTDKQKKAAWIVALILIVVHFAPGIIHAMAETFSARFHHAASVKPSPSHTFTPLPPDIVSLATPPPATTLLPRFYGNWEGSQFRPTLDQCKIHLLILPSVEFPGQISAYKTRVCFDSAYIVGGNRLPQGGLQQLMVNASPISTVMTGQPNKSGSQIDLHVDKIVGSTPSQCPLVSYSTSIFGDQSIVAQWKAGTCANGDGRSYSPGHGDGMTTHEPVLIPSAIAMTFEPLISAKETGHLLGLHPVTLLRWAREGRIPHRRLGRKVTFRTSELNARYARSTLEMPFVSPNLQRRRHMNHTRARYQQGSLTIEKRRTGSAVWVYRWREIGPGGQHTRRKRLVGTKLQFPSRAAALRAVDGLRLEINNEAAESNPEPLLVDQLIEHYRLTELTKANRKTTRTKQVYAHQLTNVISPRWGTHRLKDVKPIAVETWLNGMQVAPGTKAKTKGVLSILFQHAMRYGFATTNPIRLVRQSALPLQEEIVLAPFDVAALLAELRDPFYTLILLVSVTGLRRGELFGLKWEDVNFKEAEIRVVRSVVDQVERPPKTLASRRPLPMSAALASSLVNWQKQTSFAGPKDWIFASPSALGTKPYWPDAVLKRHVLPAAERAGIAKKIGWHSFRRTLATLLQSSGASVKVTQDLLRHSSPLMTMGVYAKAVTADKRNAQDAIAALFVEKGAQSAA